jgi:hypothetical protein
MEDALSSSQIPTLLTRLGELLERRGRTAAIVVVGGAALNLLGVVERSTVGIDIIAIGRKLTASGPTEIAEPHDLPPELTEEVTRLTRDFDLPQGWLNTTIAMQWQTGLPPGFASRIEWRRYGSLWVGLAGRWDLVALKLHAAADNDPKSRHVSDLIALRPSKQDLETAAAWVSTQDVGPAFQDILTTVVAHVAARTS